MRSRFTGIHTVGVSDWVEFNSRSLLCEEWWRWVMTSLFGVFEILGKQKDLATPSVLRKSSCNVSPRSPPFASCRRRSGVISFSSLPSLSSSHLIFYFLSNGCPSPKSAPSQTRVMELPLWRSTFLLFYCVSLLVGRRTGLGFCNDLHDRLQLSVNRFISTWLVHVSHLFVEINFWLYLCKALVQAVDIIFVDNIAEQMSLQLLRIGIMSGSFIFRPALEEYWSQHPTGVDGSPPTTADHSSQPFSSTKGAEEAPSSASPK